MEGRVGIWRWRVEVGLMFGVGLELEEGCLRRVWCLERVRLGWENVG